MPVHDAFREIARYYDPLMSHVNYERWHTITTTLARLLPPKFLHVDAACGTGTLVRRLRASGWNSVGIDLSVEMIRAGQKKGGRCTAAADLRALPFRGSVQYITCLFDSINFMLTPDDMRRAVAEWSAALADKGLLYFDAITEKMVLDHFDGQNWNERNGRFSTSWSSQYDRTTATACTHIRVHKGPECVVRERVYPQEDLERALHDAGLTLLGVFDADTWKSPRRRSTRIEFVAAKAPANIYEGAFKTAVRDLRRALP